MICDDSGSRTKKDSKTRVRGIRRTSDSIEPVSVKMADASSGGFDLSEDDVTSATSDVANLIEVRTTAASAEKPDSVTPLRI